MHIICLIFVLDKSQPSALRGEIFDQHSWGWDERAIPVILEALQEDNNEIQFWTAFALVTLRWYWHQSDLEQIISALDSLVQNENIAPGMWHVGREAIYPLERAYYRQINDEQTDSISFKLISPRLEYWDFKMAQGKNEEILETGTPTRPGLATKANSIALPECKIQRASPENRSLFIGLENRLREVSIIRSLASRWIWYCVNGQGSQYQAICRLVSKYCF